MASRIRRHYDFRRRSAVAHRPRLRGRALGSPHVENWFDFKWRSFFLGGKYLPPGRLALSERDADSAWNATPQMGGGLARLVDTEGDDAGQENRGDEGVTGMVGAPGGEGDGFRLDSSEPGYTRFLLLAGDDEG